MDKLIKLGLILLNERVNGHKFDKIYKRKEKCYSSSVDLSIILEDFNSDDFNFDNVNISTYDDNIYVEGISSNRNYKEEKVLYNNFIYNNGFSIIATLLANSGYKRIYINTYLPQRIDFLTSDIETIEKYLSYFYKKDD